MAAADSFAALAREFELELLHLKQMLALLEAERRELLTGGTEGLDAITAERLVQADPLELYASRPAAPPRPPAPPPPPPPAGGGGRPRAPPPGGGGGGGAPAPRGAEPLGR